MKKTKSLVAGIILLFAFSLLKAQSNPQFNKVILVGKGEIVPAGKVWKISSAVVFTGIDSVAGCLIHPMDQSPVPRANHLINQKDEFGNNVTVNCETGFVTMVPKSVYENITIVPHVNLPLYLGPLTTVACGKDALRITVIEFNIIHLKSSETEHKQLEPKQEVQNELKKTNAGSVEQNTVLPKSNKKPVSNTLPEESCDLIIFKNGDEIEGKVTEISIEEIKFKKCENLDGPLISILKMDVFLIKHPNGTKDVFNTVSSTNKESSNTNQSVVPVVNETQNVPAEKIISKYSKGDIYRESSITWFGLDFSLFHLVYSQKIEKDGELRGRINALQKLYENDIPQAKLRGWFSKANLLYDKEYSENLYHIYLKQDWISSDYHDISINEIQEHLKKYKSIGKGIGLVMIPEVFNEDKANYTIEFVWFDIESKTIIHTQKISGRGKGGKMMATWDDALLQATKIYVDDFYKKEK